MSSSPPEAAVCRPNAAPPRSWSLAARLTTWYAASTTALLVGVATALHWALVANLEREDDQLLANKIHVLRRRLSEQPRELAAIAQEVRWQDPAHSQLTILVRLLDHRRRTLIQTPGMDDDLPPDVFPTPATPEQAPPPAKEWTAPSGKSYRLTAAEACSDQPDAPPYLLQAALDCTFEENLIDDFRRMLWLIVGGAIGGCAVVSFIIARRGLWPLHGMAAAAARIGSATLNERLDTHGLPTELADLAATFNAMLDRLEDSFQRLSRFSADIAHELRTPVNNLRGEAEVALGQARSPQEYRDVLGSVLEECGRLARLIDSLLFLARAESPEAQLAKEPIDLAHELAAIAGFYEATAEEAKVSLTVTAPPALIVNVDRPLFQRVVGNLLANAFAHTPAGGAITVSAAALADRVAIEVADTGSGIAPQHLPFVFDRFYRADA
ncbi:MAG: heavy metal sensor histidine kinase, partial [Gemmataceae bacterium]|nr:heavy metal sensor histidine kinase [Gemmataceae bacterium]